MKKLLNKYRHRFIRFIYRCLRTDMVIRMRVNGISWTKINGVLRVLGQKQIVQVEKYPNGERITYAHVALQTKIVSSGKDFKKVPVEPTPEIIQKPKQ